MGRLTWYAPSECAVSHPACTCTSLSDGGVPCQSFGGQRHKAVEKGGVMETPTSLEAFTRWPPHHPTVCPPIPAAEARMQLAVDGRVPRLIEWEPHQC